MELEICLTKEGNKMNDILLNIKNLKVWYKTYNGNSKVIDGINFYVKKKEKVGLVGEAGCGKTTTMRSILRVLDEKAIIPEGNIFFKNADILKMSYNQLQQMRKKIYLWYIKNRAQH